MDFDPEGTIERFVGGAIRHMSVLHDELFVKEFLAEEAKRRRFRDNLEFAYRTACGSMRTFLGPAGFQDLEIRPFVNQYYGSIERFNSVVSSVVERITPGCDIGKLFSSESDDAQECLETAENAWRELKKISFKHIANPSD